MLGVRISIVKNDVWVGGQTESCKRMPDSIARYGNFICVVNTTDTAYQSPDGYGRRGTGSHADANEFLAVVDEAVIVRRRTESESCRHNLSAVSCQVSLAERIAGQGVRVLNPIGNVG